MTLKTAYLKKKRKSRESSMYLVGGLVTLCHLQKKARRVVVGKKNLEEWSNHLHSAHLPERERWHICGLRPQERLVTPAAYGTRRRITRPIFAEV